MVKEKTYMSAKCKEVTSGVGENGQKNVLGRSCVVISDKSERRVKTLILEEE